jgi:phenylpropionate dioxygenase-like ring-hydroxylating dioxygenase large terminal subunit
MDRALELHLIEELLGLREAKSHFLDQAIEFNSVDHYQSERTFNEERESIFARLPAVAAHVSEIPNPGDFVKREVAGRSIIVTRDAEGDAHAFLNVCRHRGTQLVSEESGCKQRFTCPYHAWTYANSGELVSAPHLESGFPELDRAHYSLKSLQCDERFGFIWVVASPEAAVDFGQYFASIAEEAEALDLTDMFIAREEKKSHRSNWKILVEGGLESYHFKVAHRKTIGPFFEDNLSSYQVLGDHMRSVLMRSSMHKLKGLPREQWRLRDHANIIYTFFPTTQLLVQQDHVVWINSRPLSATETELRLVTLAPRSRLHETAHWEKNHQITAATLNEDFAIGESIQAGFATGANDYMTFGRFEGALPAFNKLVKHYIGRC